MIDSHCHIDLPVFDSDREQVLLNAANKGVRRILVPGLGLETSKALIRLKSRFDMLDIAAGFHPFFLTELTSNEWHQRLDSMSAWIAENQNDIVAIGEFGLDGTLALSAPFQQRVFVDQLDLAKQFNKPVVVHHRKSHNDIIRLLKQQHFQKGGVIHAFSGSAQIAQSYIDLGFKLGVGGTITYPRGEKTRKALKEISLSDMLVETDAPDMPICGYQGMRNTPERLGLIAESLANVMSCEVTEVASITSATYMSLFSSRSAP